MFASQQSNSIKRFVKASIGERIAAAVIFVVIFSGFVILWLGATGRFEIASMTGVCGFYQRFGLPCPGCFVTRSGEAFVQGHIVESFYIQPAGGVLFSGAFIIGVFSLLLAVFGLKSSFLCEENAGKIIRYSVLVLVFVFACGWAVTLARTLAGSSSFQ